MKTLLTLTAAAVLFCTPVVYADDPPATTTPDSTMSTDSSATDEATSPTAATNPLNTAEVELKTADGTSIHGTFNPADLSNLKVGDKLEVVTLPSDNSSSSAAVNPDTSTDSDSGDE